MRYRIFALSMIILVAFAAGAQAHAQWRSALAWSSAKAETQCPGDYCVNSNWRLAASTSVSCVSSGVCDDPGHTACSAYAWALGRTNWTGASRVKVSGCGWAGPQDLASMAATEDTLGVSLVRSNPTTLLITLTGVLGPGSSRGVAVPDSFRVVVWDFGSFSNPDDTFGDIPPASIKWAGSARLTSLGVIVTSGAISPSDFTLVGGEWVINKGYTIAYSGSDNVIAVGDVSHAAAAVPTLSTWGILLLVALLLGTGIYVLSLRRRAPLQA